MLPITLYRRGGAAERAGNPQLLLWVPPALPAVGCDPHHLPGRLHADPWLRVLQLPAGGRQTRGVCAGGAIICTAANYSQL